MKLIGINSVISIKVSIRIQKLKKVSKKKNLNKIFFLNMHMADNKFNVKS